MISEENIKVGKAYHLSQPICGKGENIFIYSILNDACKISYYDNELNNIHIDAISISILAKRADTEIPINCIEQAYIEDNNSTLETNAKIYFVKTRNNKIMEINYSTERSNNSLSGFIHDDLKLGIIKVNNLYNYSILYDIYDSLGN